MTDSISGNQGPSYQSYSSSPNQTDQASQQFQTFLNDHPTAKNNFDQLNESVQKLNSGDCQHDAISARDVSQYFSDLINTMGTGAPDMILSKVFQPKLESLKLSLDQNDLFKDFPPAKELSEHIESIMQGHPPNPAIFAEFSQPVQISPSIKEVMQDEYPPTPDYTMQFPKLLTRSLLHQTLPLQQRPLTKRLT